MYIILLKKIKGTYRLWGGLERIIGKAIRIIKRSLGARKLVLWSFITRAEK